MRRLERVLEKNLLTRGRWEKTVRLSVPDRAGADRLLLGCPEANIVGATASLLLQVDEAQDVSAREV